MHLVKLVIIITRDIKTGFTPLLPCIDRNRTVKVTSYTVLRIKAKIQKVLAVHEAFEKIKHATCLRQYDSAMMSGLQVSHDCRQLPQLAYRQHSDIVQHLTGCK